MMSRILLLLYLLYLITSLQIVIVRAFLTKIRAHKIEIYHNLAAKGEAKKGEAEAAAAFSMEDAKQFVQVLDEKGTKAVFITIRSRGDRVEIALGDEKAKFSTELKNALRTLATHVQQSAKSNIVEMAQGSLYLFGSKLTERMMNFAELKERFTADMSQRTGLIGKFIHFSNSSEALLERKWTRFQAKMDQIKQKLTHLILDEEFVENLVNSNHFYLPPFNGGDLEQLDEEQMEQLLLEREKQKGLKWFKFDKTERTMENLCHLLKRIKRAKLEGIRPPTQINAWAALNVGTFSCPNDTRRIVETLKHCWLLLDSRESHRAVQMFRSGHFHQWLMAMHVHDYQPLKDLLSKKKGSENKLIGRKKRLTDAVTFRKLKKKLLEPIIQSLAKLGTDEKMWFIKGNLFKMFILELGLGLHEKLEQEKQAKLEKKEAKLSPEKKAKMGEKKARLEQERKATEPGPAKKKTKMGLMIDLLDRMIKKPEENSLKFADKLNGDSKAFDSVLEATFNGVNAKLGLMENMVSNTGLKLV